MPIHSDAARAPRSSRHRRSPLLAFDSRPKSLAGIESREPQGVESATFGRRKRAALAIDRSPVQVHSERGVTPRAPVGAVPLRIGVFPVLATLNRDSQRTKGWIETADLVEKAQNGDREAFGQLVEQFQRTVYAIALGRLGNSSEALELTQEVFLHVMKRIGQLREPERFAGWLRQVAARMAINRATRRIPPASIEDEILEGAGATHDDPLDSLIARERATRLWDALGQLKPLDRESLVSFYIQGQSLIEIAESLDVPIGTVKRRLHTARNRLKAELRARAADADEWSDSPCFEEDDAELEALAIG